jgi:uncharacterized damage-inducible protein DinB
MPVCGGYTIWIKKAVLECRKPTGYRYPALSKFIQSGYLEIEMGNTDQLLKENIIEALKQVHQYIVLGLGTSASALALALKTTAVGAQSSVTVPGTFVAVDPQAARAVLLAVCFVAGAMAYYSADAANRIAQRMKTSPELLEVAGTYPSIATFRFPGVRYVAALLPFLFAVITLLISAHHHTLPTWSALWIGLVLIGSAYISLAMELQKPIGTLAEESPISELAQALVADSYAAAPSHIIEGLPDSLTHQALPNAPHTIYQELYHITFWQQLSLDWITGKETPFPEKPSDGFNADSSRESWDQLCQRFLLGAEQAATIARDTNHLDQTIHCSSRPGHPVRIMTVRDQLISLATHNAYHFGRIVLMRQLLQVWPPPSGGYSW